MKFEYGLVIVMGILVVSSLALIYNNPEQIPHWNALSEIKLQDSGFTCDLECMEERQIHGASCTNITKDEYVCRPAREITFPEREYPIPTAWPMEYGEFAYFPEGKLLEMRIFDVAKIELIDPDTKQIAIEFSSHLPKFPETEFTYFATMYPGDTFVAHCTGSSFKTGHIVEYMDVFDLNGITYIEFWGVHVTMPDKLIPCQMPELIEHSLPVDLSLGIKFEMENE